MRINSFTETNRCHVVIDYKCFNLLLSPSAHWRKNSHLVAFFELCSHPLQCRYAFAVNQKMQIPMHAAQLVVNVIIKLFSIFFGQLFKKRLNGCRARKLDLLFFLSSDFTQRGEKAYSYLNRQFELRLYSVLLTVWLIVSSIVCPCT